MNIKQLLKLCLSKCIIEKKRNNTEFDLLIYKFEPTINY